MRIFLFLTLLILGASPALAREQIRIVGSSTVYPFVSLVAEQFGMNEDYRTPIVESTGTGGGFKLFCAGVGDRFVDINNASRAMLETEVEQCRENGVTEVIEVPIGYDGIVIANSNKSPNLILTKEQLFLALAAKVPDKNGGLVDNFYTNWKQIDSALPDMPIAMYGPPPTSGTRDAFVELVLEEGCSSFPAYEAAYPDKKTRKHACAVIREDGVFVEAGEDDNLVVQKLISNPDAIGIVGFAFFEENKHRVQASKINGAYPSIERIADGSYAVSRSMYVYVKPQHFDTVHGFKAFIRELINEGTIGDDGYLVYNGLIPLGADIRAKTAGTLSERLKE